MRHADYTCRAGAPARPTILHTWLTWALSAVLSGLLAGGAAAQCTTPSFTGPTNFAASNVPVSVTTGDFNGDGRLDLAVANQNSGNVSILLGNGLGSFSAPTNFAAGAGPFSVTTGDFNGDGRLDLATANYNSDNASILLGNGLGSFSAPTNLTAGDGPTSVTTGDFNRDGRLDLVVASLISDNVSILLGNGLGGFTGPTNFAAGNGPESVTTGDFNRDGRLDLAVANGSDNVSILLGNGTGAFTGPTTFAVGDGPFSVTTGDFNGDGRLDLATANWFSDNASILLGNGAGAFTGPTNFAVDDRPSEVATGDFNGDGRLDLAVANEISDNVSILLGNGLGGFTGPTNFAAGDLPVSVTTGDFNGDGRLDLAVANVSSNNVSILLNTCRLAAPPTIAKTFNPATINPGATTQLTLTFTNPAGNPALTALAVTDNLPTGVTVAATPGLVNTCGGMVSGTTAGSTSFSLSGGTLAAGLSSCQVQVNVTSATPGPVTNTTGNVTATGSGLTVTGNQATATLTVNAPATSPLGPGLPFPAAAEVNDQKAGSVLVYNLYSSNATSLQTQNTRISITNTNPSLDIAVHLFFVDGQTCSIADALICLTKNQTATFLASDLDPGTTGYIVGVASDPTTGCPVNFNFLIGDVYVKLTSGHAANLGAEAFSAISTGPAACDGNAVTAQLNFDGTSYNRVPRTLAASSIPARADGNDTLLILNRFGGNLATGAATLTNLFGIFYDDAETALSFSFSPGVCQFRSSLANDFPRTATRLETFIPAGRSGWLRLYSTSDLGLLGAVLNYNPNAGTTAGAFNQGRNLHKLTLTSTQTLVIPIFPPNCLD